MTKKDLTREKALRLHYKMWTEMQEKLGDNPTPEERYKFKSDWCYKWARENNYGGHVRSNCFLCECVNGNCDYCLIDWGWQKILIIRMRSMDMIYHSTRRNKRENLEKYFDKEVTDEPFYAKLTVDKDLEYCRPIIGIWMHDYNLCRKGGKDGGTHDAD